MAKPGLGGVERPVEGIAGDTLDRAGFAAKLVDALVSSATGKATGVVLGVTGSWGSGKSSVLNMVADDLRRRHPKAIVVRFDPWLIAGRNDLISTFLQELGAAVGVQTINGKRVTKAVEALDSYAKFVAPVLDLAIPGSGTVSKAVVGFFAKAAKPDGSLTKARAAAAQAIAELGAPVVVLIDELDRVDDDDVRTMAQLVRSIADFEGMSYLLAYDPPRVAEALGGGTDDPGGRGRAYLEKIVQLPIALPILLESELQSLLGAEVGNVHGMLGIGEEGLRPGEHQRLVEVIVPALVSTPRDVKRLIGVYQVLAGMLQGEVDLADVLGFSALQVKTPRVMDRMRSNPESCVVDPLGFAEYERRRSRVGSYDPFAGLLDEDEAFVRPLLLRLFPALGGETSLDASYPDAIGLRRGLMTALRLGALPGAATRSEIETLLAAPRADADLALRKALSDDTISGIVDRLAASYPSQLRANDRGFWLGASDFLQDPTSDLEERLVRKRDLGEALARVMTDAVHRRPDERVKARGIYQLLDEANDFGLVPTWLHGHLFVHGLFGVRHDGGGHWFLPPETTNQAALNAAARWKSMLLANELFPAMVDAYPLLIMLEADAWDDVCVQHAGVHGSSAVDTLAMVFFGGTRLVARDTIQQLFGYDRFVTWIDHRLSQGDVAPSLRKAFDRARQAK